MSEVDRRDGVQGWIGIGHRVVLISGRIRRVVGQRHQPLELGGNRIQVWASQAGRSRQGNLVSRESGTKPGPGLRGARIEDLVGEQLISQQIRADRSGAKRGREVAGAIGRGGNRLDAGGGAGGGYLSFTELLEIEKEERFIVPVEDFG